MTDLPDFCALRDMYQSLLLDDIIPYWEPHVDMDGGGIYNCIKDDGTLISEDAYMWSQLRALWLYSKLYDSVENRQEWLDAAKSIYRFVLVNGRDSDGEWVYHTTREGEIVEGPISIYTDGFALLSLAEYYRATAEIQAEKLAVYTAQRALDKLARPGSYQTAPYEIPKGLKCHGVSMVFSLAFWELGRAIGESTLVEEGYKRSIEVMDHFLRPEHQALHEYITLDNETLDSPIGRCVVPGHAIESMWFQIHILGSLGDQERVERAFESIRWHLERGWDPRYGGIFLGIDLDGIDPPYWQHADVKAWWPHTEALYALLLA